MKFFLTTAIDFVNSKPHLGTAYEKITADIIARYRRLAGFETHFLMGNDEHSQNVFKKAAEAGKDPLAYCDEMEQVFRDVWKRVDLSFDPTRLWVSGRASIQMRIKAASVSSLTIKLAQPLAVASVSSPTLGDLLSKKAKR